MIDKMKDDLKSIPSNFQWIREYSVENSKGFSHISYSIEFYDIEVFGWAVYFKERNRGVYKVCETEDLKLVNFYEKSFLHEKTVPRIRTVIVGKKSFSRNFWDYKIEIGIISKTLSEKVAEIASKDYIPFNVIVLLNNQKKYLWIQYNK